MNYRDIIETAVPGARVTVELNGGDTITGLVNGRPLEDPYGGLHIPITIDDYTIIVEAPSILTIT